MKEALEGGLDGAGLRVGLVVARFNEFVTSKLLDGSRKALVDHGVKNEDVTVVMVPGSFEIPLAAQKMAESGGVDAVVCLGAVIKGETDHYEHVSAAASEGISNVSLSTGVPIGFGVLTTENAEQAIARAGGDHSDTGYEATEAAIEMANLLRRLDDI